MDKFEILTIDELLKRLDQHVFKQLHIHHTWKPTHKNFNGKNHIELQRGMYNYHTQNNGWSDVGQHVTLMPDGLFVTGRGFHKAPASIKGWNTGAFAVEMLGNFDKKEDGAYNNLGYDQLEGKQKESVLKLAKYFANKYGENSIKFHREGPSTEKTCPGTSIDKQEFIKEVINMGKVFKDVDVDRWSSPYIKGVKELGIMSGYDDGTFNPTAPLTREEAAVIIMKLYEKITGER